MKKEKFYSHHKIIKKFVNVFSWFIIVTLLIIGSILLYYVINAKIHEKQGKEYFPPFALYTIISPSMEPNIKVYDVVITKKIKNPEKIKKGDVITFISTAQISNDLTVTHRVSDVKDANGETRYITKGDNNVKEDEGYVLFGNVMGKVVLKIPQLGRVQFLLASKGGWFILVMLPAMGIIIYDLLKLFKLFELKDDVITLSKKDKKQQEKDEKSLDEQRRKNEIKKRIQYEKEQTQIDNVYQPKFESEDRPVYTDESENDDK